MYVRLKTSRLGQLVRLDRRRDVDDVDLRAAAAPADSSDTGNGARASRRRRGRGSLVSAPPCCRWPRSRDRGFEQEVVDLGVALGLPDVVAPDVGAVVADEDREGRANRGSRRAAVELRHELALAGVLRITGTRWTSWLVHAADALEHLEVADREVVAAGRGHEVRRQARRSARGSGRRSARRASGR